MELVPFVQQRGLGVPAHPASAHFVYVQPRRLPAVVRLYVLASAHFQDLGSLRQEILQRSFIILIITY
jgi:hypothetical protein